MVILLLVPLLTGCAKLTVQPKPIEVKPIEVNHNVKIDPNLVRAYYLGVCDLDPLNDTEEKVQDCTNNRYNDFLNAYSFSTGTR